MDDELAPKHNGIASVTLNIQKIKINTMLNAIENYIFFLQSSILLNSITMYIRGAFGKSVARSFFSVTDKQTH